ncbi:MAG: hypothetical protein M0R03_12415, partial [Novosphingobium sp.]|nr:hypothetical protein [Novosphingobium sp.]
SSIDLQVYTHFDITNFKIRAEVFDNSNNSIQIATSNSGGTDLQILITDASNGIFTLHVDKDLTTNFLKQSFIEIELEDADGDCLETRVIPIELSAQEIRWTIPS